MGSLRSLEGSFGKVPKKINAATERVFSAANSLAKVVDDFLNISRIEQGRLKYTFAPFDVRALLEEILAEQQPAIEKKNLKLTTKVERGDYALSGDRDKLRQVFANMIDNAIKYTPKGDVAVKLSGKTKVVTALGESNAYYLESTSKQYGLWFKDDAHRIPLRIDGAMGIGKASLILKSYKASQ